MSRPTPVGAIARGLFAGAVGTAAMDATLFARYRRSGGADHFGPWESSSGLDDWAQAPAPAQVGKRTVEGLFQTTHRVTLAKDLSAHLVYGLATTVALRRLTR